ncbi:hypothetical protein OIO90_003216 [Microbotryomycetes sp. JL221]|nr:hypothetical protein OIO90_003216 [Microbotryomycetes sp. JL221]
MSFDWTPLPDWTYDPSNVTPPSTPPAASTSNLTLEVMAPLASVPSTQSRITLQKRPSGEISPDLTGKGHFLLESNVPIDKDLKEGECLVKVEWVSLDPAMRGWLNPTRSYIPPVEIGAVMRAGAVGRIVILPESSSSIVKRKQLAVGDWVSVLGGWQEYAKVSLKECQKIPPPNDKVLPSFYLGALGMPGQTAYWGLEDVIKIQKGETIVITGAAGAVGSVACQICKIRGLKVIAVAGGPDKCKWLQEELGVDVALDYKSPTYNKEFREATKGYIDCMFDNVGGELLDLALGRLKKGARIALCGAISGYNSSSPPSLKAYLNLISQRAKIEGFIVFDYASRYREADKELQQWVNNGQLKVREHKLIGLDKCVEGLRGLFLGTNYGKALVQIGSPDAKL